MSHIDYGQEITEKRLHTLLSRVRDRVRKPYDGLGDPASHVRETFAGDIINGIYVSESLARSCPEDLDSRYFLALADEFEDSERLVEAKWRARENAILYGSSEKKNSPGASKSDSRLHQTTLEITE